MWRTWKTDHLVIPPGKRYEVLVQGGDEGTYSLRTLKYDQGFQWLPNQEMATVTVGGTAQTPLAIPKELPGSKTTDLTDADVSKSRRFVFTKNVPKDGTDTTFRVNDEVFDHGNTSVRPTLGTVEEWTLVNDSSEIHPFHIHVNDFQVMSINGKPYHAAGLQDVVSLPVDGEVVIRNPFNDFTGEYVFHCHILFHEDNGMMKIVDVVK